MKKRALIIGITGQDGSYLADLLLNKGYEVFGTYRRLSTPNFWRLQYLEIYNKVSLLPCDLIDSYSLVEALKISNPEEVYNLAALSYVGASFEQATASGEITGLGVTKILEAIRLIVPGAKFYQASTSELYGDNNFSAQDERTPFEPSSPYAASKLYAHHMVKIYRNSYNLFACNGILFNHESPLRGLEFVTRKITNGLAKIKLGLEKTMELGNIEAHRDWGYAPEYVEAMWLILQKDTPDDYVIATNETHSIREFLNEAFKLADLNWENYVRINERLIRPLDVKLLKGDYTKASVSLKWEPKVKFKQLIEIMFKEDLSRWKKALNGEHFPWDASNYPNERNIISRTLKLEK
jgi:GDPmannose 4,6-dehydratase